MSKYTLPPLTTVRQPIPELSEEAVNCLLSRKEDPERTSRTIKLKLHLEVRDSTAPLASYRLIKSESVKEVIFKKQ
jgi:LacI family xylobiose transport system transcriptional regulator